MVPVVIIAIVATVAIEGKKYRESVLWTMLGIWLASLIYLMFLCRLPGGQKQKTIDFLHMYREAMCWNGAINTNQALRQILFNILLYIPFGVILVSLNRRLWSTVLIGIGLSVGTEVLQYWTGLGWADIDDVISNTIGLLIGIYGYVYYIKSFTNKTTDQRNKKESVSIITSCHNGTLKNKRI